MDELCPTCFLPDNCGDCTHAGSILDPEWDYLFELEDA